MCRGGTDAIHQHTPAEIPRQLRFLGPPEPSESRPSRNSPVVPRAGVVNARRPGRRPGRSEAKSIDDAEHGASINRAMVQSHESDARRCVAIRETWGDARPIRVRFVGRLFRRISTTNTCTRAARFLLHELRCADSDMRHDQRWRERPRLDGLGSLARQDSGVVHAIVGSATATRAPAVTAAQSAASMVVLAASRCDRDACTRFALMELPGVRERPERASKPGGQPDAIFAWPPSWPRHRGPSCR